MDSIIGRSQFVSETANLFTDEKTATARAKVGKWFRVEFDARMLFETAYFPS